ncbi:hypothetical protein B0H16DRAFT_1440152 [Mycena metata]|uniref:RING-type domain-containing protein n=1 Tax=Mycena metata TaxID=1033252 RepID=A0AAD7DZL3_9AGAR|nr:hypothetical protein B0H16DRAFT_1440152 [Mycena metata]
MANCSICLEGYTNPVSLPCGHVFCLKCIRQMVDSVKSRPTNHFCPTCRAAYSLLTVDPKLVPPYLRPHILPPIRRVFIDDAPPSPSTASGSSSTSAPPASGSASTSTDSQLALALAEISTLRRHCATWRQRAESHAMGNNALLGLARAAKDCALRMRAERDAERSQCVLLKRKLTCVFSMHVHYLIADVVLQAGIRVRVRGAGKGRVQTPTTPRRPPRLPHANAMQTRRALLRQPRRRRCEPLWAPDKETENESHSSVRIGGWRCGRGRSFEFGEGWWRGRFGEAEHSEASE